MTHSPPPKKKRKLISTLDQEIEDNHGYLLSNQLDRQIQSGLYALRNDDPLIYDRKHSFIKSTNDDDDNDDNDNDDNNNKEYKWVKQLDDPEKDKFLQQFFSNKLWKCNDDDTILSTIGIYKGYKGNEHLDDIDLMKDDEDIDKQNDFERNWQKKKSEQFDKEIKEQQSNNKCLTDDVIQFLEDSD